MFVTKQKDIATAWLGYVAKATGYLVMLLGGVVMAGWIIGSTTLIQLRPQLVPMQFNTALGFVLGAAGLLLLLYNRPRLAMGCGGLLAGFALLTLLQYPLGADFGIDRLLFEPDITTKSIFPGRMAPATALAHFLAGLALLALTLAKLCHPHICVLIVRTLGMGVLALGLGSLLGYAVGEETPYGWLHATYTAIHTAVGFMLLGSGLLAFVWRQITGPGQGKSYSTALESSIGLAVLAVVLWQSLLSHERLQSMQFVVNQAANLSAEIEHNINHQILAVNRMARRWEDRGGTPRAPWRADATRYLQHNQGLQAITWVDSSMHVRWIEPLQGNEAARDLYLPFEPRRTQALETARLEHAVTATRNIELVQGGRAVIAYFPLYLDDRFDGYIGAVFHIDKLLDPIVASMVRKGFGLELFEGNEEIYRRVEPGAVYEPAMSRERTFGIVNLDWRLRLQPSQALLAEQASSLPLVELIAGLLLALLLGLTVDRAHAARQRAATLAIEAAERKSAQKALVESELWQRNVFNALDEGVMVATPDRLMLDLNQVSQTLLGYSQEEIAGQPTAKVHVDHDHAVEFGKRIKAAFDKGEAARFEFELKRKNGEVFPTEHSVSLIRDSAGEAIGIVSTLRDITVRKQVDEELRHHREHLEELVAERTRELEHSRQQLRDLTVHLQTVREEERVRIARDVHDELGQVLTALNMDVHWLQERIAEDQVDMKRKVLSILPFIASAIESVQRITSELRPAMLDELGLEPAIQWYLEEFQVRTGIECEFTMVSDDMQIGSDRATAVFRILQEALTNVVRHAVASRVSVDIKGGDDHLDVQITDNGRGISPSAICADNAFGLLGMKERALAFGGSIDIAGHPDGGTTVSLYLPLAINLAAR